MEKPSAADKLFKQLERQLQKEVDEKFFTDPKIYKSLIDVVEIVNTSMGSMTSNHADLLSALRQNDDLRRQCASVLKVIEQVVQFQHGGLNNSVDIMGEVLRSYSANRDEVRQLRSSLKEAREVLTQKRTGHVALKDLWLQKIETEESLRILDSLEKLKDAPAQVVRCVQQRRYVGAVCALNIAIDNMFNDDLVAIAALESVRQQLLDMKATILDAVVGEVKAIILEVQSEEDDTSASYNRDDADGSEARSESSQRTDRRRVEGPSDDWAADLSSVTEELERTLVSPASSTPQFATLLVRAVGLLGCEDDLERFLLEEGCIHFESVIQKTREQVLAALAGQGGEDVRISPDYDVSKNFSAYAGMLLEKGIVVLRRLLHVMRLLSLSKQGADKSSKDRSIDLSLKRATGAAVLVIWTNIERAIFREFHSHFAEFSVEQISDKVAPSRELVSIRSKEGGIKRDSVELDDDDLANAFLRELPPLFPTSAYLAATVYRDVVEFSEQAYALLSADISFELLVTSNALGNSVRVCSTVLDCMKKFLEEELMPVVQSAVNKEMREMQTNSGMFAPPISLAGADAIDSDPDTKGDSRICKAARKLVGSIGPLFALFIELPQHRDATLTILDRAMRGFVAIAREEIEALTFRWKTSVPATLRAVLAGMVNDPLFLTYRRSVYDGKESIEELAQVNKPVIQAALRRGSRAYTPSAESLPGQPQSEDRPDGRRNAGEMDSWGWLWKMGGKGSEYGASKYADDADAIAIVASVATGSDWIVCQLFRKLAYFSKSTKGSRKYAAITASAMSPFRDTIILGTKELSKLAEECLALLRGEMQIGCFHFLHNLSHMKTSAVDTTRSSSSFIIRSVRTLSDDANDEDNNSRNAPIESEAAIVSLHHHLFAFERAVLTSSSPDTVIILLSPLCSLIPQILSTCAKYLRASKSADVEYESFKTRFLRAVAVCHQLVSALLEEAKPDPRSHRLLQDIASEDFELTRRVADTIDQTDGAKEVVKQPAKTSPPVKTPSAYSMLTLKPNEFPGKAGAADKVSGNLSTQDSKLETFFESVTSKFPKNSGTDNTTASK